MANLPVNQQRHGEAVAGPLVIFLPRSVLAPGDFVAVQQGRQRGFDFRLADAECRSQSGFGAAFVPAFKVRLRQSTQGAQDQRGLDKE